MDRFLEAVKRYPVAVVDTGSENYQERKMPVNAIQLQTPYKGYDTGAYLWAYFNIPAKNYLFLQDSCMPTHDSFVEEFACRMPDDDLGAVAWVAFEGHLWDTAEQRTAMKFIFDAGLPLQGIFGPIFYTSRSSLDLLRSKGLLPPYPTHKMMAQGMERGWAMAFEKAGMPVNCLYPFLVSLEAYATGMLPPLKKEFAGRT